MKWRADLYTPSSRSYLGLPDHQYPFKTARASSPPAASPSFLHGQSSISGSSTREFGSSPLCDTISATSTNRPAGSNQSTTPSHQQCCASRAES